MSYSEPPSRSGAHLSMVAVGSYDRPSAEKVISNHAGTVLEDGLDSRDTVPLSGVECENAKVAFQSVADGASLDIVGVRRALQRRDTGLEPGSPCRHIAVVWGLVFETAADVARLNLMAKALRLACHRDLDSVGEELEHVQIPGLNMKLDDELFERLVERRWEDEEKSTSGSVDSEGFLRIYGLVLTPSTIFGQHLRKAAGRGDEAISETALHTMAAHGQVDCAKAFKALCGHELMIEPRDKAGWTPLMVAAGNGHTPFMRFLLEEGANPDIANAVGRTAMHRAASRGRENALKTLISRKAEVNCKDECGYTPLHLAAMHDEAASMRLLLEAGADVGERDILGYPPSHYCSDRFWQKLIDDRTSRK